MEMKLYNAKQKSFVFVSRNTGAQTESWENSDVNNALGHQNINEARRM